MADPDDTKAEASAEKAYAAAAEAVSDKDAIADPAVEVTAEASPDAIGDAIAPVEFPAKPKRARKPRADVAPAAETPAAEVIGAEAAPVGETPAKPRRARAVPAKAAKPTAKRARPVAVMPKPVLAKPAPAKPASGKPAAVKLRKPAARPVKAAAKIAPKPVKTAAVPAKAAARSNLPFIAQLKEIPMDVSNSIKEAVTGAQAKAKEAFSKTSAAATEASDFAKGNVEAFVESGKILATGLQELGNTFLADSKTAFDTATADVKMLTSVKSPTDFFQIQTELLRRNIDHAVAYSSKTSESLLKLTNDVIAPLSGRVNLAVEKIKKAA